MKYCDVLLPLPLDHPFSYRVNDPSVPDEISVGLGCRVIVPFGRRKMVGIVMGLSEKSSIPKIKSIEKCLDATPLCSPLFLEWLQWAAHYYLNPLGEVLLSALPSSLLKIPSTKKNSSNGKSRKSPFEEHWIHEKRVLLNPAQQQILDQLTISLNKKEFAPALLLGITGSGKTEVYLHFIEKILEQGKQVIFLVPEIGLTPQIIGRMRHFFGEKLALYHSGLTDVQRAIEWWRAKKGEVSVMVGTRSALFAPFPNLGAIIIDEEHDPSYKQEERFRYHARDLALVRGKMEQCPVLMGSATPSLETFQNVRDGKFAYYELPERGNNAQPPTIQLVDMASQKRQTETPLILCRELHEGIQNTLKKGEQVLLLLNRRGFARSLFCLACQTGFFCPNCSVALVYHRKDKKLLCHYCDTTIPLPKTCPSCGSLEVTLIGFGTQTVEDELKTFFPAARIARLDRDSTQKKGEFLKILKQLKEGKIDILVGTQMIAKGHDFEKITLVGVIGIDSALSVPDFRSAERTFQLLMQVAGRAGRGSRPGHVIVQTLTPNHYSIQLACEQKYIPFFDAEIVWRKELGYPPAGRLIQIRFSATSEKTIEAFIKQLGFELDRLTKVGEFKGVQVLGPSPSPLEKIRGRFRWHLILKGGSVSILKGAASKILPLQEKLGYSTIRWSVDVDPLNML